MLLVKVNIFPFFCKCIKYKRNRLDVLCIYFQINKMTSNVLEVYLMYMNTGSKKEDKKKITPNIKLHQNKLF